MDVDSIPVVDSRLTAGDRLGRWLVRWSVGRDRYRVEPGLYRIGEPDAESIADNPRARSAKLRALEKAV